MTNYQKELLREVFEDTHRETEQSILWEQMGHDFVEKVPHELHRLSGSLSNIEEALVLQNQQIGRLVEVLGLQTEMLVKAMETQSALIEILSKGGEDR